MLARIDAGAIRELRRDLTMSHVPEHKRQHWREVPPAPEIDRRLGTITGPHTDGDSVAWGFSPIPLDQVRASALARLDAAEVARTRDPKAESHAAKADWALNRHMLGNTIYDDLLRPEAEARGMTIEAFAQMVHEHAAASRERIAQVSRLRVTAAALVKAAPDAAGIIAAEDVGIAAIEACP